MAFLDKSVILLARDSHHYGFGKGLRGKCIGDNENVSPMRSMILREREDVGMLGC